MFVNRVKNLIIYLADFTAAINEVLCLLRHAKQVITIP